MVATTAPTQTLRDTADLPIPGAISMGQGRKKLTALMLLKEVKQEWDRQRPQLDEAEFRERVVMGEQWIGNDVTIERVLAMLSENETLICENLSYPLMQTWSARVNTGRVDARCFPFQPNVADSAAAEASNKVLDYHKQKVNEDVLIAEAADLAQMHGDVLFLPTWDPSDGPHLVKQPVVDEAGVQVDMATGETKTQLKWEWGGVTEEVIAAPDYCTSGEEKYERAQWVSVRRVIDQHLAYAKLKEAGYDGPPPKPEDFPTTSDTTRRGVEAYEIWLKPGPRTKLGAFVLIIANYACKAIPWPLKDRTRLPGAVWKIGNKRSVSRGKTHVSDAIHQQRLINHSLRAILKRCEAAEAADLFGPSGILTYLKDNRYHRVPTDAGVNKESVFWVAGPEIPPSLFQAYQNARRALYDVFGISEATTTGGDPTQTSSGAQLQTATALDAQKIGPARRRLEECRKIVAQQILELWQTNVSQPTLVRVLGDDGAVQADYFRGADLAGADVALEIRSGIYSTHLAESVTAEQQGAAGQIPPQDAVERSRTGLRSTQAQSQTQTRVDAQAAEAARGQQVQPYPDVDAGVAIQRIHMAMGASMARGGQVPPTLLMLLRGYEALAQQMAKVQSQQGQPQQGPGRMDASAQQQAQKGAIDATKTNAAQLEQQGKV